MPRKTITETEKEIERLKGEILKAMVCLATDIRVLSHDYNGHGAVMAFEVLRDAIK